jgi:NAD(P)-dependent dehydrogenase (short-subunit alcohol dehydrogenase family)
MALQDELRYDAKRTVVTGAASGMGNATVKYLADLGAEIVALDVVPIEAGPWTSVQVDIGNRASIDAAVEAIGTPVDRLFNVAGVAGGRGTEKLAMVVNFFGLRYLTERLLPAMPRGGAIVNVASLAGFRYLLARAELEPMLALSIDDADAWLDADENQDHFNGYGTAKELLNLWTVQTCKSLAENQGVRINVVAPGTTETPLLEAFKANAVERTGSDQRVIAARGFLGRFATSEDQAAACVFLNSDAASMITGQILAVDGGMWGTTSLMGDPGPRGR